MDILIISEPLNVGSQSVLVTLVLGVWIGDFMHNTPYKDLLPPNSMFFAHPLAFVMRYWEIYEMHIGYVSEQTAERRRQRVADVRKRSEYRKAHGMDQDEGTFGGWTAKSDVEVMGPGMKEGDITPSPGPQTTMELARETVRNVEGRSEDETFVDFEGNRRPMRKKWFGIW